MKNVLLITFIILSFTAQAQWSNTSNNYTTGNLGVGLNNTSQKKIWVQANVNDHIGILENISSGGVGLLVNAANDPLRVGPLGDYSGAYFKIATNGNVGVGTNSPRSKLTIGNYTGTITTNTGIALGGDQNTIEFLNSSFGNGFGAKLYGLDQGNGLTSFRLAVRANSSTWTDAIFIHAGTNGSNGGNLGYVGLGTTAPTSKLDVSDSNSDLAILKLRNSAWACNQRTGIEFWNGGNKSYPTSRIVSQMDGCGADGEALVFETQTAASTAPSAKFIIKNNGNVGIGTTDPGSFKLAVNGKTWTTEVQVAVSKPPDYVFEPTYSLSPLDSIKTYIDKNKHLPEVPSAREMEKNGVELGRNEHAAA